MKRIVLAVCTLTGLVCMSTPSANSFVAVTNDWYNANFSNVYELAQQRLSSNANDVVAAYLMLEWNMSFASVSVVSSSITRVIGLSDAITNSVFAAPYRSIRADCLSYRDEFLLRLKDSDVEAERHKAYLPHVPMTNAYMLRLLDRIGLW